MNDNTFDLIRRSEAIDSLGEAPYVWTDDDEFAQGELSQWICDVNAIKAVPSANMPTEDGSVSKSYILAELSDLLDEYSELDENGLHDPKWCGVSEAFGVVKNAPSVDRPQGEWVHLKDDEWLCPNCGHVIWTEGSWEHPLERGKFYCENCGANLKGEADEKL